MPANESLAHRVRVALAQFGHVEEMMTRGHELRGYVRVSALALRSPAALGW